MVERLAGALRSLPSSLASIRVRTVLLASVAVAAGLIGAAFGLVALQRDALTDNVDVAVTLRADDITSLLREGTLPAELTVTDVEVSLVQVLDESGTIVLASQNIAGHGPVVDDRPGSGESSIRKVEGLPIDDDEGFRVLTRGVETQTQAYTIIVAGSLDPVHESIESLVAVLRWGLPLLIAGVAGGIWVLVGRALSPVEAIRREVAGITRQQLGRRVPEPGANDEIARLARTMNEMLDRLESAQERQDRFVGDASHELRSPLASIRTQLEVDLARPESAPWESTMSGVREDVVRMQRLVDDLLLLARSDAGEVEYARGLVDLDDVVLAGAAAQRESSDVEIDTSAVSAGQVRGDSSQLQRVVRNLLENATRYASTRVAVTLRETNGAASLIVEDDGAGIPAEERNRIFERFSRLDSARARDHGGAGLGLSIVRTIVEGHGGAVSVDESAIGGARFVVKLPTNGAHPAG